MTRLTLVACTVLAIGLTTALLLPRSEPDAPTGAHRADSRRRPAGPPASEGAVREGIEGPDPRSEASASVAAPAEEWRGGVRPGAAATDPGTGKPDERGPRTTETIAVEGRVEDESGIPVEGAEVQLLQGGRVGGAEGWMPEGRVLVTGRDGAFSVGNAPTPAALRAAAGPGHSGSLIVPLEPGIRSARLRVARRHGLRGRVFGPDGRALAGVEVRASGVRAVGAASEWAAAQRTDEQGRFGLLIPPGVEAAELDVPSASSPDADWVGLRLLAVATGSKEMRIDLPRPAWITGRVRAQDGEALDARVVAEFLGEAVQVSVRAEADGTFRVGPLRPGRWKLTALPDGQVGRDREGRALAPSPATETDAPGSGLELRCPPAAWAGGADGR